MNIISAKLDALCYMTLKTASFYIHYFDTISACDGQTDGHSEMQRAVKIDTYMYKELKCVQSQRTLIADGSPSHRYGLI